jgi:hypothetical protein
VKCEPRVGPGQDYSGSREDERGTQDQWLKRHGDEGKWMILLLARQRTGMTLRELGEALRSGFQNVAS